MPNIAKELNPPLMIDHPQQLVFELAHRPALGVEDFLVSHSNQEAVALVDRWPNWPVGAAIISGPPGSGKSHLANVWRLKSNAAVTLARDVTMISVPTLAAAGALVVEDIASLTDEQALFHILNLVREQRLAVLLTSNKPPGDLAVTLPDLRSRLKALPFAGIAPPDDALLQFVLVKLFADRQLTVEPSVIAYIMLRMERSLEAARLIVAEVDRQALTLKRGATRAVASAALEKLGFSEKDS
jgi:chromosomal replication initiation ATPase DnaA